MRSLVQRLPTFLWLVLAVVGLSCATHRVPPPPAPEYPDFEATRRKFLDANRARLATQVATNRARIEREADGTRNAARQAIFADIARLRKRYQTANRREQARIKEKLETLVARLQQLTT